MLKEINNNGVEYKFNIRAETGYENNISDLLVIKEILEEDVYQVPDIVEGNVVDIGANIGIFSILCAKRGASKVFALEPEPENFKQLVSNIDINNVGEIVEAIPMGLWHENTEKNMFAGQGASIVDELTNTKKMTKIKLASLEPVKISMMSICELFGRIDGDISVMKVDCEWSEYDIIKNIPTDLLNRVEYITLEFHSTTAEEFGYMLAKLSEVFNIHIIGSYNRGGQIYGKRY